MGNNVSNMHLHPCCERGNKMGNVSNMHLHPCCEIGNTMSNNGSNMQ